MKSTPSKSNGRGTKSKAGNHKKSPAKTTTRKSSSAGTQMENSGLMKLFEDQLKDIYWAEKALTKAIPKMIRKTNSQELADALEDHLNVTEGQVTRCEEVFAAINKKPVARKCEAMQGLIEEANELMTETEEGSAMDAAIICAAQKVEHYEIATYGTLATWARQMGHSEAADLLEETLNEEKEADSTLTELAEANINEEAMMEEED